MSDNLTMELLLVLVAAAFLGMLIGACIMQLRASRKFNENTGQYRLQNDALDREASDLRDEKASMLQALEAERKLAHTARDKLKKLTAQQEAIQVHARLQAQRLSTVEAELQVAEEKGLRLERDFASYKANKLREVRMLKSSSEQWLESETLPVLNKRVSSETKASNEGVVNPDTLPDRDRLASSQPLIARELDIPSLAESELPDSVDELEFELAVSDEPGSRG